MEKKFKVIIFDMDGVLVDSEPLQKKAFLLTLKPYNITLSDEEFSKFVGIRTYENFLEIKRKYKIKKSAKKLTEIKNKYYIKILKEEAKPQNGIIDILEYLLPKYILTLASSSPKKDVFLTLKILNIKKYFRLIVTGDDVKFSKPSPEIFLKVASKLNVKNDECAVIEDSENGIKAAKNAGMFAIAIPTSFTRLHNFEKADLILNNILEIKNYL